MASLYIAVGYYFYSPDGLRCFINQSMLLFQATKAHSKQEKENTLMSWKVLLNSPVFHRWFIHRFNQPHPAGVLM